MKETLEDKKLMWFGHTVRMGAKRQAKNVWETRPSENNRRERQDESRLAQLKL